MTDTSVGVREQLLHKQTDRQGYTASEQLTISDINSTEGTLVNDVASNQDPPSSLHSFPGSKIPGWPDRPLPLTQTRTSTFVSVAIDFVLLIFSLLFLALAAGALAVSGRGIGDNSGELIEQASRLGPTVFPIVFAALMSRALKAIGRFKSEKGIEMSTLWAFLSTKTVFDAFILQWSFGALSLPTILIGLLWGMSPAGGQASLRILYRTNQTSVSPSTIRYMDTGPLGLLHTYVTLLEGYDLQPNSTISLSMTSSFAAALMQDIETKTGPRDSWGNPKIPRIDTLNRSAADENGWIDVSQGPTVESFISLFGLPLLSVPNEGIVEFGIESTYVQLSIASIEKYPSTSNTYLNFQVTCPRCIKSAQDLFLPGVFSGRVAQLLGPPYEQPNTTQLAQQSLTDAGLICFNQPMPGLHFRTNLSFEATQILVETRMVCEKGSCRATKIRPSATDHRPRNITVFDFWGVIALDILNQANGINTWGLPSMLELFMNETSTIPVYRAGSHGQEQDETADINNLNLANIKLDELSGRATLLLNTAVQLLYSHYGFAGGLPSFETTDYGPPHIPSDGVYAAMAAYNVTPDDLRESFGHKLAPMGSAFVAATTEASVTRHYTIYRADYAWVMVLVISSLALAIMGSVGMVTGLRTRGPDVFDPLMGLTYNNGSLGLPTPGSTLDTNTRAKLLRGMRVRLGDVAGGESVGMIGVGRTPEVGPLIKGRLYE